MATDSSVVLSAVPAKIAVNTERYTPPSSPKVSAIKVKKQAEGKNT